MWEHSQRSNHRWNGCSLSHCLGVSEMWFCGPVAAGSAVVWARWHPHSCWPHGHLTPLCSRGDCPLLSLINCHFGWKRQLNNRIIVIQPSSSVRAAPPGLTWSPVSASCVRAAGRPWATSSAEQTQRSCTTATPEPSGTQRQRGLLPVLSLSLDSPSFFFLSPFLLWNFQFSHVLCVYFISNHP